jgi:hypothetical protein
MHNSERVSYAMTQLVTGQETMASNALRLAERSKSEREALRGAVAAMSERLRLISDREAAIQTRLGGLYQAGGPPADRASLTARSDSEPATSARQAALQVLARRGALSSGQASPLPSSRGERIAWALGDAPEDDGGAGAHRRDSEGPPASLSNPSAPAADWRPPPRRRGTAARMSSLDSALAAAAAARSSPRLLLRGPPAGMSKPPSDPCTAGPGKEGPAAQGAAAWGRPGARPPVPAPCTPREPMPLGGRPQSATALRGAGRGGAFGRSPYGSEEDMRWV